MDKKELKTMTMVVLEFSQTLLDLVQVTWCVNITEIPPLKIRITWFQVMTKKSEFSSEKEFNIISL